MRMLRHWWLVLPLIFALGSVMLSSSFAETSPFPPRHAPLAIPNSKSAIRNPQSAIQSPLDAQQPTPTPSFGQILLTRVAEWLQLLTPTPPPPSPTPESLRRPPTRPFEEVLLTRMAEFFPTFTPTPTPRFRPPHITLNRPTPSFEEILLTRIAEPSAVLTPTPTPAFHVPDFMRSRATPTPRPARGTPTPIPLTALPTLPPEFPHSDLGYRWLAYGGNPVWQGAWLVRYRGNRVEALAPDSGLVRWRYQAAAEDVIAGVVVGPTDVYILVLRFPAPGQHQPRVVAVNGSDGSFRWQSDLEPVQLTGEDLYYTLTASPSTLYLFREPDPQILAVDGAGGGQRWSVGGCRLPWLATEGALFATCEGRGITQLDAETGEATAWLDITGAEEMAYADGVLVVLRVVDPKPHSNAPPLTELLAFRWPEPTLAWRVRVEGLPGGLVADGEGVVFRAGDTVYRLRPADGSLVWRTRLPDRVGYNLARTEEILLVGSRTGYVHALDWETGFWLWEQDLWTVLRPAPMNVNVFAAAEGMLLVGTNHSHQEVILALAPSGEQAWPTPTFTPTPSPPPVNLFALEPVTPPPPDWTPTPPASELAELDPVAWAQSRIRLLSDMINSGVGDAEVVRAALQAVLKAEWGGKELPAQPWVARVDLDADEVMEWLVSIPRLHEGCQPSSCPGLVVLFEGHESLVEPVQVLEAVGPGVPLSHPRLVTVEDLTGDGVPELVLRSDRCVDEACETYLLVGGWNGEAWRALSDGTLSQVNTEVSITDRDGDGVKEIVLRGGVVPSAREGPQRAHTLVYALAEERYRLVADIPSPSPHIYFRMLDANRALAAGNLERALDLAMQVVMNPRAGLGRVWKGIGAREQARIVSYAAVQAMLVHALRREPGAMRNLLFEVEAKYNRPDNPYAEAARRLWDTYWATQDPIVACRAAERAVRERLDQAAFLRAGGENAEQLALERICPLDGDLGEGRGHSVNTLLAP